MQKEAKITTSQYAIFEQNLIPWTVCRYIQTGHKVMTVNSEGEISKSHQLITATNLLYSTVINKPGKK